MKKQLIAMIAGIAAAVMMTGAAFAGEFVETSDGLFYNTGYDTCPDGWAWIFGTDGLARCYYFDENGCAYTNRWTPDGYYVNERGEWVDDGQVVTKGYRLGMWVETDYSKAAGNYYAEYQFYSDDTSHYYKPGDLPVTVEFADGKCCVTSCTGNSESTAEWFENYSPRYSFESGDHRKLLDYINAKRFRIVDLDQGTETFFRKSPRKPE